MTFPFTADRNEHRGSMARSLCRKGVAVAQWLNLPGTAGTPDCASIRYWDRPERVADPFDRSPVLFVHGYAGTEHIWRPLRAALADAGFGCLIALRYNAFRADIHQVADWLVDQARRSMEATGVGNVHLIGHSMGGLVVRAAVQTRGLAGMANTAVTIGTPHAGAKLARFVPGPAAQQMRPGSAFLADLGTQRRDGRTRWVTVHGGADRVVPSSSGQFDDDTPVTVRQASAGHGSIARHPEVVARIVSELLRSETLAHESFSLAA